MPYWMGYEMDCVRLQVSKSRSAFVQVQECVQKLGKYGNEAVPYCEPRFVGLHADGTAFMHPNSVLEGLE